MAPNGTQWHPMAPNDPQVRGFQMLVFSPQASGCPISCFDLISQSCIFLFQGCCFQGTLFLFRRNTGLQGRRLFGTHHHLTSGSHHLKSEPSSPNFQVRVGGKVPCMNQIKPGKITRRHTLWGGTSGSLKDIGGVAHWCSWCTTCTLAWWELVLMGAGANA